MIGKKWQSAAVFAIAACMPWVSHGQSQEEAAESVVGQAAALHQSQRILEAAIEKLPASSIERRALVQALANNNIATVYFDQGNRVRGAHGFGPLDNSLFGDHADLYTGALQFRQTDVSLSGNNALQVALARKHVAGRGGPEGQLGDWDLEIPHLRGIFSVDHGWVDRQNGLARCSNFSEPGAVVSNTNPRDYWAHYEFWNGNFLSVPGADGQEILVRASGNVKKPTDGQQYPLVTRGGWQLRCLAQLANGSGEGFMALGPDGTRYRFDWMASRHEGGVMVKGSSSMSRLEVRLMPTEVKDRFGNTVTYSYDPAKPWNLTKIEASDGRKLTLTYVEVAAGIRRSRVSAVSDGTRTWTYSYDAEGAMKSVTLPDQSQWSFELSGLVSRNFVLGEGGGCVYPGNYPPSDFVGSITHPSGARGEFTTAFIRHQRLGAPIRCVDLEPRHAGTAPVPQMAVWPKSWVTQALTSKVISSAGQVLNKWTYQWIYGNADPESDPCCSGAKRVLVTDLQGNKTRYTYGATFNVNEGQQLRVEEGWDGSQALKTTVLGYRAAVGSAYPSPIGSSDTLSLDPLTVVHRPMDRREVRLQGESFVWSASEFDVYARPLSIRRNGPGGQRTEVTAYYDDERQWVLGQIDTVTDGSGHVMVDHDYHEASALLARTQQFGVLQQSFTYNTDGTLASRTDGRHHSTSFSNYKRGLPQTVSYPNGSSESAVVNDLGQITSVTSAAGYITAYGYDSMGRLACISPPSGWRATPRNPCWSRRRGSACPASPRPRAGPAPA